MLDVVLNACVTETKLAGLGGFSGVQERPYGADRYGSRNLAHAYAHRAANYYGDEVVTHDRGGDESYPDWARRMGRA